MRPRAGSWPGRLAPGGFRPFSAGQGDWLEMVGVVTGAVLCHPCFLEDAPAAFKNGIGFSSTFLTD